MRTPHHHHHHDHHDHRNDNSSDVPAWGRPETVQPDADPNDRDDRRGQRPDWGRRGRRGRGFGPMGFMPEGRGPGFAAGFAGGPAPGFGPGFVPGNGGPRGAGPAGPGPRGFGRGGFGPGFGPGGFGPGAFGPGGFGPGFGRHGGGPGRGRRGRGNVRAAVLALLAEEPQHGYALMTELTQRSGGLWKPSPGSIYPVLQQLQDEGLVSVAEADGRRVFSLTDSGRSYVAEHADELTEPWKVAEHGPRERVQGLMHAATALAAAVEQVARLSDDTQATRAVAVLDEARRAMYRILSEEGGAGPDAQADARAGAHAGEGSADPLAGEPGSGSADVSG